MLKKAAEWAMAAKVKVQQARACLAMVLEETVALSSRKAAVFASFWQVPHGGGSGCAGGDGGAVESGPGWTDEDRLVR